MRPRHRHARSPAAAGGPAEIALLDIDAIGDQGDGIAEHWVSRVFVPFTLPGERVQAEIPQGQNRGHLIDVLTPSPERIVPVCPHFGICGGCQLQHWEETSYLTWKRELLVTSLARVGIEGAEVDAVAPSPMNARRRARLNFRKVEGKPYLGFAERASHRPVDVQACAILRPALMALLPKLRAPLVAELGTGAIELLETRTGIDALIETEGTLSPKRASRLAELAEALDLARLSARAGREIEPIAWRRAPELDFSGVMVTPAPGGFVQASALAEAALVRLVATAVGKARSIADLFSGCGTFTFALARRANVLAVEGDAAALGALAEGARRAGLGNRVVAQRRNLDREPLSVLELNKFDAVVFDPPRAGARNQASRIAQSAVPVVVAVSCDPGSFARDAAVLVAGGYRLERVSPVDQFLWTSHLELVAGFRR